MANHNNGHTDKLLEQWWNQDWFTEKDYDAGELGRFYKGAGLDYVGHRDRRE